MSDNLRVAPAPIFCKEKARLLDAFVTAVSEYLKVEAAMLAAVRDEESLFDSELEAARKRKDAAKDAIKAHQKDHGC